MPKTNLALIALVLIALSIGCKSFMPAKTDAANGTAVDLTTPQKGVDAKVELDKKQTASSSGHRAALSH